MPFIGVPLGARKQSLKCRFRPVFCPLSDTLLSRRAEALWQEGEIVTWCRGAMTGEPCWEDCGESGDEMSR